jgi:hypothetical protein
MGTIRGNSVAASRAQGRHSVVAKAFYVDGKKLAS